MTPLLSRLALFAITAGCVTRAVAAPATQPVPVVMAVDGINQLRNLPVLLADKLGYFTDEGLAVTFKETSAGADVDAQLTEGSIVGMAAYYHHTIVAQVDESRAMEAVVTLAVTPGYKVLASTKIASQLKTPADLKGRRIIAGGPHSAKSTSANWLILHAGLKTSDYVRLSTSGKAAILAALQDGTADLVISPEPDASTYVTKGAAVPYADLYSVEGTKRAIGSVFPSSVLYMSTPYVNSHRELVQHLVNALVRTLAYINSHSPAEIRKQLPSVDSGQSKGRSELEDGVKMFATDGTMPADAARAEADVIATLFPQYGSAKTELTYTNEFVGAARKP